MSRSVLLYLCLSLYIYGISAQGCTAKANLIERPGSWMEAGLEKRIFDVHVVNSGSCNFKGDISLSVVFPAGTFMGYSWGYNPTTGVAQVPELGAGQTHSGIGFIVSGHGTPTVSVTGFASCSCATSTTGLAPPTTTTGGASSSTTGAPSKADSPLDIDLKFLILSCNGGEGALDVAKLVLQGAGATADVFIQSSWGTQDLPLTNTDGSGKYYAIISATALTSCWSAQIAKIEQYEKTRHIKTVILYASPTATSGVATAAIGGGDRPATLSYAPAMSNFATSINTTTPIAISGSWVYPATINDATIATPAINLNLNSDPATTYVAAAFVAHDGLRRMEFYFDSAPWALYATITGPAWFNWVTNGLFEGSRRIYLNCHMDDVFMNTGTYDPKTNDENEKIIYRITPADLDQVIAWQNALVARMPAGSSFKLTFPFNGATVIEKGGYGADALFLHAKANRDHWFWESHTFTHPYLTNFTYQETYDEYHLNNDTVMQLFDADINYPGYTKESVITPSITGLFNGDALRAMWDLGIRNLCNDNSHAEQLPKDNYHGWYTNMTSNGFDGMYIVPRFATNIYYHCNVPQNIVDAYNHAYNLTVDFDYIIATEVGNNTIHLLQLRHDPYMFHQANMRTFTYKSQTTSLVQYWVDNVVDNVMKYSTLPFLAKTHTELAEDLQAREARDACGFQGRLRVDASGNTITGIKATSTGTCTYGISGVKPSATGGRISYETSNQEKTTWIDLTAGSPVEVAFETPISVV